MINKIIHRFFETVLLTYEFSTYYKEKCFNVSDKLIELQIYLVSDNYTIYMKNINNKFL